MNALSVRRLIPLVYFLVVSFPHHFVSGLLDEYVLVPYGMDAVQSYANLFSYVLLFGLILLGVRAVKLQGRESVRYLAAWFVTIALMYVVDRFLIVNNIERIHFPQYAVLAMLLALSLKQGTLIFVVSAFAGMIDEFQQYVLKPSHTNYLDFNDFVLNILGAALGVLIVLSLFRRDSTSLTSYEDSFRRVFRRVVLGVASAIGLAILAGRLTLYADVPKHSRHVVDLVEGKWQFILSFQKDDKFWVIADNGKQFHAMTVFEGVVVVTFFMVCYWFAIRWLDRAKPKTEH